LNNQNIPTNSLNNLLLNPFNNPFLINTLINPVILNLSNQGIFNVHILKDNLGIKESNIINLKSKKSKNYKRKEISSDKDLDLFKSDSDEKVDFSGEKKKVKRQKINNIRKMKSIT